MGDIRSARARRRACGVSALARLRARIADRRQAAFHHADWLRKPRHRTEYRERRSRSVPYLRLLAHKWSHRADRLYRLRLITLRDFRVCAGCDAWHRAVEEVQRVYPGTAGWLLSCSASEGGWGRFVYNSEGSGVYGPLQFMPSTFSRMSWAARVDVASRGFIVPASAASWHSALGQALAGGWGLTHGRRHEWAGAGC